ncbi:peptidase S41, partial [Thioclava sp. BHET1]
YSSAFHDWSGGDIDETTPAEIAERIVPVGALALDRIWVAESDDTETLDRFCQELFNDLNI